MWHFSKSLFVSCIKAILEKKPELFKTNPYGDNPWMLKIQQGKFNEVLDALKADRVIPEKDFCRMTFTQMALICGASKDQLTEFAKFDAKFGNNLEARTVNGAPESYMIAANMVNLPETIEFLKKMGAHGKWQSAVGDLNRTIAHVVFLPSPQKGNHSKDDLQQMVDYLISQGVRFDVPDSCGYTARQYAQIYHAEISFPFDKEEGQQLKLPDPNQILDFWGSTSVQAAILAGDFAKLKSLYETKATFASNHTKQTPLHVLCCSPAIPDGIAIDMVELLITVEQEGQFCMTQSDINGFYPIHNAASFGMVAVFNRLLQLQYDGKTLASQLHELLDSQGRSVAHDVCMNTPASEENSIAIAKSIIREGGLKLFFNADKFGIPPIVYAWANNKHDLVNLVLGARDLNPDTLAAYLDAPPSDITAAFKMDEVLKSVDSLLEPADKTFVNAAKYLMAVEQQAQQEDSICRIS